MKIPYKMEKSILEMVSGEKYIKPRYDIKVNKESQEKRIAELEEQNIKDCENFNKAMKEIKKQFNNEHYQLTKAKK